MSDTLIFPPKDFHYGGRKPTGEYEHHPVMPESFRPREMITHELVNRKRLFLPEVILHKTCSGMTYVGVDIVETLLVSPKYSVIPYRRMFCALCRTYLPTGEFVFADSGEPVDARLTT